MGNVANKADSFTVQLTEGRGLSLHILAVY